MSASSNIEAFACGKIDQAFFDNLENMRAAVCEIDERCTRIPTVVEIPGGENLEITRTQWNKTNADFASNETMTSTVGGVIVDLQIIGNNAVTFRNALGGVFQPVFGAEVIGQTGAGQQATVQVTFSQAPDSVVIGFNSMNSTSGNYTGEDVGGFNIAPDSIVQSAPAPGQGEVNIFHTWNNPGTVLTFTVSMGTNVYGIWNAIGFTIESFIINQAQRINDAVKVICTTGTTFEDSNGDPLPTAVEVCCSDL